MLLALLGAFLVAVLFGSNLNKNRLTYSNINIVDQGKVIESFEIKKKNTREEKGKTLEIELSESYFFNQNPKFISWVFMFCILGGVVFGFIIPNIQHLKSIVYSFGYGKPFINALISMASFGLLVIVTSSGSILPKKGYMSFANFISELDIYLINDGALKWIIGIMFLANAPSFFGMFFVNFNIGNIDPKTEIKKLSSDFHILNQSLKFFLFVNAIVITLSTVTTGFGREAVLQAIPGINNHKLIPIEFVYLYGLTFTVFLAIIYLPIHFQLRQLGEIIIKEKNLSMEDHDVDGEKEQSKQASSHISVFTMQSSWLDNMKVSFAILGPLLTSLVGEFIPI
jgi:hypothetical protein